jgi:hypothetical protein
MMRSTFFLTLLCLVFLGTAHGIVQEDKYNPVCIIKTSMGDIFVELFAKEAPKLLAVIYNDPVADNKTDPPQTINFYRQHNKYWF